MHYDTLIIGAGMSGLAAGIRLAYYDQRVCILERHSTIGGLNSFYRLDGRNYDVGLHAVTNFAPKGTRGGPLGMILRQLKLKWDELELIPQRASSIVFPGARLRFSNDFELLRAEVARQFPSQADNFDRLVAGLVGYDDVNNGAGDASARQVVSEYLSDPLLVEMLFCPVMFYGNAAQHDMPWDQYSIMFRSLFLEGLSRPRSGVRIVLRLLVRKYKQLGGELRLRAGVQRVVSDNGRATGVVLDDGTELSADRILSSAGWCETMRMCGEELSRDDRPAGQLSFVESLSVLDKQPAELDCHDTITFFNDSEQFHWEKPEGLVDVRSGVICSPNNFAYDEPLDEGLIRVTALANFDRWSELPEERYGLEKLTWYDRMLQSVVRFVPDFRRRIVATDMFTPLTIRRFTWHDNGAVYGAPRKQTDGTTPLSDLYICGTDQGWVGIVGSIISGITMANRLLK